MANEQVDNTEYEIGKNVVTENNDILFGEKNDNVLSDKLKTKKKKIMPVWAKVLITVILVIYGIIITGFCFFINLFQSATVSGFSMYPTINQHWIEDNLDTSDVVFYVENTDYQREDIIIANNPTNELVIKRLIAFSGDEIKFKSINGEIKMLINNEIVTEEYLTQENITISSNKIFGTYSSETFGLYDTHRSDFVLDNENDLVYKVPQNCFFYLGDNRGNSNDCSNYGAINLENLVAKVYFTQYFRNEIKGVKWFFYRSYYGYVAMFEKIF